jgi:hypothetical protein
MLCAISCIAVDMESPKEPGQPSEEYLRKPVTSWPGWIIKNPNENALRGYRLAG